MRLFFFILSFSFTAQSIELNTESFYFCSYKTATQVKSRTIRIHYFPEDKKCAVFYSVKGIDKMIASGKWMSFCETKAKQIAENLKEKLWECKIQEKEVKVFYPIEESSLKETQPES